MCDDVVTMAATVDVEGLSDPRTLYVLDRGSQLEQEYAALVDAVEGVKVVERGEQADNRLSHWDCQEATARVLVDTEDVSRDVTEWLAATAADFEDGYVRVAAEAREKTE